MSRKKGRTTTLHTASVVWTNFPVSPRPESGTYKVTDVFESTNSIVTTNGLTYTLGSNSMALLILEPNSVLPTTNYVSLPILSGAIPPGSTTTIVVDDAASFFPGATGASALRVSHGALEIFNWQLPREKICGTNIAVISCFATTSASGPTLTYASRVAAVTDANVGSLVGSVSLTKLLPTASTKVWVTNTWTITSTNATVWVVAGSGNAFTPSIVIDLIEQAVMIY